MNHRSVMTRSPFQTSHRGLTATSSLVSRKTAFTKRDIVAPIDHEEDDTPVKPEKTNPKVGSK